MIDSSSIVSLQPEIYFSDPNRYIGAVTYNCKEKKVSYNKNNNQLREYNTMTISTQSCFTNSHYDNEKSIYSLEDISFLDLDE